MVPEAATTTFTVAVTGASRSAVYTETLDPLECHFASIANVLVERRRFTLQKPPDEPARAYVGALRQLSKTCDYGDFLETSLRDKLDNGIRSVEMRQKLLLKGSQLTIARAVEILQTYEQAAEVARPYEEGREDVNVQQVERTRCRPASGSFAAAPTRKCYRCGTSGHLANAQECRARGKRCAKCHLI